MHPVLKKVQLQFQHTFGEADIIIKAPGRANIIGEHIDYNDGFAFLFAVPQGIYFAMSRSDEGDSNFHALDLDIQGSITENGRASDDELRYFAQVIKAMNSKELGVGSVNVVYAGDLPIGAGMSSSSALTCGFIIGLNELYNLGLTRKEMVLLASEAENGTGVEGGKMDQYSIVFGQENRALLLDCSALDHEYVSINMGDKTFLMCDTGVSHNLVETAYNDRRQQSALALQKIKLSYPSVKTYRDVTEAQLSIIADEDLLWRRARHVYSEIKRVDASVEAINNSDWHGLGSLLHASHHSLAYDYQVSCEELDFIVSHLKNQAGVFGSRMMGGGFGGCVIVLCENDAVESIISRLSAAYKGAYSHRFRSFIITPSEGLQLLPPSIC